MHCIHLKIFHVVIFPTRVFIEILSHNIIFRIMVLWYLFCLLRFTLYVSGEDFESDCKWDIHNCGHSETLCKHSESVYLDAKFPKSKEHEHCFAVQDVDKGEFENYEISVEMLSLESTEGTNSGNVGIMFNFLDEMNYDFVFLE